jgi:hypothetical protein
MDTSASTNRTYYYWLRANRMFTGWTDYLGPDTGIRKGPTPTAPTDIAASDGTYADYVRVTWTSTAAGSNRFWVYRRAYPIGPTVRLADTTASPYDDGSAVPGT